MNAADGFPEQSADISPPAPAPEEHDDEALFVPGETERPEWPDATAAIEEALAGAPANYGTPAQLGRLGAARTVEAATADQTPEEPPAATSSAETADATPDLAAGDSSGDQPPTDPPDAKADPGDDEPKPRRTAPATEEYDPGHFIVDSAFQDQSGNHPDVVAAYNRARNVEIPQEREKTEREKSLINAVNVAVFDVAEGAGADLTTRLPSDKFYRFYPDELAFLDATGEMPPADRAMARPDGIHIVPTGDIVTDAQRLVRYTLEEASIKLIVADPSELSGDTHADDPDELALDGDAMIRAYDQEFQDTPPSTVNEIIQEQERQLPAAEALAQLPGTLDTGYFNTYGTYEGFEVAFNALVERQVLEKMGVDSLEPLSPQEVVMVGAIESAAQTLGVTPKKIYDALLCDRFSGEHEGFDMLEEGLSIEGQIPEAYYRLKHMRSDDDTVLISFIAEALCNDRRTLEHIEDLDAGRPLNLQMPWENPNRMET
jgi:hypothetical protein